MKVVLGEHPWIPVGEVWSFCPSFDEQKDTTQRKLLSYIPEHRIKDRIWLRKGILREVILDIGTKVTFKSYEQGREKAQGAGKVLVWFDEEPPKDIYEECFVRQEAGTTLNIILTMTPIKGMTWVYDDIYLNTSNPDIFVSEAEWNDNPFLTEEQKDVMRRGLGKSALIVREKGKFMKHVGLVCSWFNRQVHVVDMKNLPPGDTFFGIDFGFTNPSSGLWVRIDREFNWWIYDGFYRKHLTNPEIQNIIRLKEAAVGRVTRIGDSAQASDIKQMNDNKLSIVAFQKRPARTKKTGMNGARASWRNRDASAKTGSRNFFISSTLTEIDEDGNAYNFLVKEIENLLWGRLKAGSEHRTETHLGQAAKTRDRCLELHHGDRQQADRA